MIPENWDETQCNSEGWFLFKFENLPSELRAYSDSPFYKKAGSINSKADELALQFVKDRAAEGSAYHIEALMLIQLS